MSAIKDMVRGYFRRSIKANINKINQYTGSIWAGAFIITNKTENIEDLYQLKIDSDHDRDFILGKVVGYKE